MPDVSFYPNPVHRPQSKIQCSHSSTNIADINPNINFDFKENSPFQEGSYVQNISEAEQIIFTGTHRIVGSCK